MNEQAAQALFDAERRGVRQIKNAGWDDHGGMCAGVVLVRARQWDKLLTIRVRTCPLCGATKYTSGGYSGVDILNEGDLVVHFNNDHDLTFGEIARKLGPDHA